MKARPNKSTHRPFPLKTIAVGARSPRPQPDDDLPIGRVLSRREALALLGAASAAISAAALAACAPGEVSTVQPTNAATAAVPNAEAQTAVVAANNPTAIATAQQQVATVAAANANTAPTTAATSVALPSCIVRPELTEGPYFVDEKLNRSDIRSDPSDGTVKEGAPLNLTVRVSQISNSGCVPLAGAQVDVWHCDALGVYSDVSDPGFNTKGKKYLRGYQVTDANGVANFTTIYPGWYQGRAVHIHFKIRTPNGTNQNYDFTSQWFFDDALSKQVYTQAPYSQKGPQTLLNNQDGIYRGGGSQLVLDVKKNGDTYNAVFDIGLQI
ncbi:MAG TPA: intradiol ring-cleavage dioxygenase [Anaerolineae bacterium]|nr:intradiol ring-cleavage dioxygenase [Anaerolineae bacterium]